MDYCTAWWLPTEIMLRAHLWCTLQKFVACLIDAAPPDFLVNLHVDKMNIVRAAILAKRP